VENHFSVKHPCRLHVCVWRCSSSFCKRVCACCCPSADSPDGPVFTEKRKQGKPKFRC